jgi:Tol biopolymer transport system component
MTSTSPSLRDRRLARPSFPAAGLALIPGIALMLAGSALTASAQEPIGSPSASPAAGEARLRGTIVFMRTDADMHEQVWTACLDLTGQRQLTDPAAGRAGWPVWSPDGTRIAFNANYDDPDPDDDGDIWDIYTMDADGGDLIRLTESVGLDGDPGYSPDGTLITFDSDKPGMKGVNVMSAVDGSGLRLVAPLPDDARADYAPRFSPDGTRIVFTREVDDRQAALWVVNLDGSGLQRITPAPLYPTKPAWSPDGTLIVFNAESPGWPAQSLWTVRPDGIGLTNINTRSEDPSVWAEGFSSPTWSPDGTLVLATHGLHYEDGTSQDELATIRPDGADLRSIAGGFGSRYRQDQGEFLYGAYKPDWRAADC